jgi:proteasome accessory factor C
MSKKSGPLLEVERLLDLVPYLSINPYISIADLAREFQVSEKEISKELVLLSMCGLPGYTAYELIDISFESGFVSITNHQPLDIPRALNATEIASLLLGLNMIRESLAELGDDGARTRRQIVDELIALLTGLLGAPIEVDLDESSHFHAILEEAIAERSTLTLIYISGGQDRSTTRTVEPLSLDKVGEKIYLIANCLTSKARRSFRLDRIEKVERCEPFSRPAHGNESLDNLTAVSLPQRMAKLKIGQNRRRYAELLGSQELPESGLVEVAIFTQEWLIRTVVAAGGDIELLDDAAGRAEVRSWAEDILALYRS